MQLLINHIGYDCLSSKQALILSAQSLSNHTVDLVDAHNQTVIMQLPITTCPNTDQWSIDPTYQVNFDHLTVAGHYYLQCNKHRSATFEIADGLLMKHTFSDVLHYFKSQRATGTFDKADRQAKVFGSNTRVDVHGGWYDASGDVSKYLSHLSYANYFNPQQIPMLVWHLFRIFLHHQNDTEIPSFLQLRLLDEAFFGADFLVRMQAPNDAFYTTVFDQWSKDPNRREVCSYATQSGEKSEQYYAAFRQGGGISIAALALAARVQRQPQAQAKCQGVSLTEFDYLDVAERGFWHLIECNTHYCPDNTENIIDEYTALIAAVELYQATQKPTYLTQMRHWVTRLIARQQSDNNQQYFWSANEDGSRPYFHAAEAGLPSLALIAYLEAEPNEENKKIVKIALKRAIQFELTITDLTSNPFGYPKQYIKPINRDKKTAFFVPHDNETGYWWQGENARVASLAAMAFQSQSHIDDPVLQTQLHQYGQNCLNWILGLNPFDMCMLAGKGQNNPDYLPELGFSNASGGICNGITSGFENEQDIAFNPEKQKDDMLQNWRWGEQWLPHGAWYAFAISCQHLERRHAH
jgi:hypothetical protein